LIAASALRLLDGSKLSCVAAADALCLLDGSKPLTEQLLSKMLCKVAAARSARLTAPSCRARSPPTRCARLTASCYAQLSPTRCALCLLDGHLLSCFVAADALRLLDGSKLSCLAAADALCSLDGS